MSKKEKLQSKNLAAKVLLVNNSEKKKINGKSFNIKGKIYDSKEFDEKSLTVESETTKVFHAKSK